MTWRTSLLAVALTAATVSAQSLLLTDAELEPALAAAKVPGLSIFNNTEFLSLTIINIAQTAVAFQINAATLMRTIMGLAPPVRRHGRVRLAGRDITGLPPYAIARLGVGMAPDSHQIFPHLTVEENLVLAQKLTDTSRAPRALDELYEMFPLLGELRSRSGAVLSGGEKKLLAIARAMAQRPSVLMLDETSEGLSPVMVAQLVEVINRLHAEGVGHPLGGLGGVGLDHVHALEDAGHQALDDLGVIFDEVGADGVDGVRPPETPASQRGGRMEGGDHRRAAALEAAPPGARDADLLVEDEACGEVPQGDDDAGTHVLELGLEIGAAGLDLVRQGVPVARGAALDHVDHRGPASLQAGVVLSGTIRDFQGAPVQGADLDVRFSSSGAAVVTCNDNSDSLGHYSVVVPTGTFDLTYAPPGPG